MIAMAKVLTNLKNELVNAQAEGYSWEACRAIVRELEHQYHGDQYVTETRVRVSQGEWAHVRLSGDGAGNFRCELVELARDVDGEDIA